LSSPVKAGVCAEERNRVAHISPVKDYPAIAEPVAVEDKDKIANDPSDSDVISVTPMSRLSSVLQVCGETYQVIRLKVMNMVTKHTKDEPEVVLVQDAAPMQADEAVKPSRWASYLSGGHSRREWLLLGERVFSHPRYAILIVVALVLCMFERYWFILAPLS